MTGKNEDRGVFDRNTDETHNPSNHDAADFNPNRFLDPERDWLTWREICDSLLVDEVDSRMVRSTEDRFFLFAPNPVGELGVFGLNGKPVRMPVEANPVGTIPVKAKELRFKANCTPAQLVALSLKFTKGWTDRHPAPMPGLVYQASTGDRWRTLADGSFFDPLPAHAVGFEGQAAGGGIILGQGQWLGFEGQAAGGGIILGQGQWLGFEQYAEIGFAWLSRGDSILHALPVANDDELVGYRLECYPAPGLECYYMRAAEKLGIVWTPEN